MTNLWFLYPNQIFKIHSTGNSSWVILPGCFGYTKNPGLLTRDPLKRDV
jgi:hypothetical protein